MMRCGTFRMVLEQTLCRGRQPESESKVMNFARKSSRSSPWVIQLGPWDNLAKSREISFAWAYKLPTLHVSHQVCEPERTGE